MKKLRYPAILLLLFSYSLQAQIGTDTVSNDLEMAYIQLTNRGMYGGNMWAYGECRSDNAEIAGEGPYDQPSWQQAMLFNATSADYNLISFFRRAYHIIFFCNRVITEAPGSDLSQALKDRYTGEAKFLRSLMFFNLTIMLDTVPVCTEVLPWLNTDGSLDFNPESRIAEPPLPMKEVFDQVKQDLLEAIPDLPARSALTEGEEFRATQGAAKALLAKTYLYESSYARNYPGDARFAGMEENWSLVVNYAYEVLTSGEYALVGGETYNTWWDGSYLFPTTTPGFRYIFTADGNHSMESVFAAQNLADRTGYITYASNEITIFTTARAFWIEDVSYGYMYAWGMNMPTQSLADAFAAETGTASDDPRFAVTIGEAGDSVFARYNGELQWWQVYFNFPTIDRFCRKFECSPTEFWDTSLYQSPINIPIIRYADVLLMAAEAELMQNNPAAALELVNMVRTRARISGTSGYPEDLADITFEDVVHERRLELAMEGHRFFDLVRWNYAHNTLNGRYVQTHDQTASYEPGTDEFLPFPNDVLGDPVTLTHPSSKGHSFSLYPNPVIDRVTLESERTPFTASLHDMSGNMVFSTESEEPSLHIDMSSLPAGVYFFQATDMLGTQTQKVVKQ